MAFQKITDEELEAVGVTGLPDTPGLTTQEMQEKFDEPAKKLLAPKFNTLINDLQATAAAGNIGASDFDGISGGTIQKLLESLKQYVDTHIDDKNNPHNVQASQTGAYTKEETDRAIDEKVLAIGAGDMTQAVYDPEHLGIDACVQKYTHTKIGTVHNFQGVGANGVAKITASFDPGDSITLNGVPVTASCGTDEVDGDTIVNGKWVSFIADSKGGQINFKGGGGLGNSKLAQATATENDVSERKTFFSKSKTIKNGTLQECSPYQYAKNVRSGTDGVTNFVSLFGIPEGIYRNGQDYWEPEIRFPKINMTNFLVRPNTLYNQWIKIAEQTNNHTYTGSFGMQKDEILLFIIIGGDRDGNKPALSLSTPGCTTLIEFYQEISQDSAYMQISFFMRIVRVDAAGTATPSVYSPGTRAVGYFGVVSLVQ